MASRVWKEGTRRGIAYVEGREVAERVIVAAGRERVRPTLPPAPRQRRSAAAATALPRLLSKETLAAEEHLCGAMAVYSDRRGRPFAWQIPFDIRRWDAVTKAAGTTDTP